MFDIGVSRQETDILIRISQRQSGPAGLRFEGELADSNGFELRTWPHHTA